MSINFVLDDENLIFIYFAKRLDGFIFMMDLFLLILEILFAFNKFLSLELCFLIFSRIHLHLYS